jgi:hypothetical protein
MSTWKFTLGAANQSATLTWNPNRTLKTLAIVDGINSIGTMTCHFNPTDATGTGYDDVGRLVGENCGTPYNETYTYDQYDNFSKSGTFNWNPGYNSTLTCPTGTICNHVTGASYDGNGRETYDLNNSFAWDQYGKMITQNSGSVLGTCGGSGVVCVTYDAFGRSVEKNVGGTNTEYLYSPIGLIGVMNGMSTTSLRLPNPGGSYFVNNSNGNIVAHLEWLGSARVAETLGHTLTRDVAFSAYGETIGDVNSGSYLGFAAMFSDLNNSAGTQFDTPNREFIVGSGSRWPNPDPARASWNAYSYPTNPNSQTDPTGLWVYANTPGIFTPEEVVQQIDTTGAGTACEQYTL